MVISASYDWAPKLKYDIIANNILCTSINSSKMLKFNFVVIFIFLDYPDQYFIIP